MKRQENLINRILETLSDKLPVDLKEIGDDLRNTLSSLIQEHLAKLDMVTREDFDIQTKVLARTRQKVEALEKELKQLEARINNSKMTSE